MTNNRAERKLTFFYHLFFFVSFLFLFTTPLVAIAALVPDRDSPESIVAHYQVKASFLPLPIDARIEVMQESAHSYRANIKLDSRFFQVDQQEIAHIANCKMQLLTIASSGRRSGAENWNEQVSVLWPENVVIYRYADNAEAQYPIVDDPIGFATMFAHQFLSLRKQETEKALLYTQSKRGLPFSYQVKAVDDEIRSRLSKRRLPAQQIEVQRHRDDKHRPQIWYQIDVWGAFPVKMTMRLGIVNIEAQLKEISASSSQLDAFFSGWGCANASPK